MLSVANVVMIRKPPTSASVIPAAARSAWSAAIIVLRSYGIDDGRHEAGDQRMLAVVGDEAALHERADRLEDLVAREAALAGSRSKLATEIALFSPRCFSRMSCTVLHALEVGIADRGIGLVQRHVDVERRHAADALVDLLGRGQRRRVLRDVVLEREVRLDQEIGDEQQRRHRDRSDRDRPAEAASRGTTRAAAAPRA